MSDYPQTSKPMNAVRTLSLTTFVGTILFSSSIKESELSKKLTIKPLIMIKVNLSCTLIIILLLLHLSTAFSQITLVKDTNPGTIPNAGSDPRFLTVLTDNAMLFSARTPEQGVELWKTDGTEAGTMLVKDINPTGSSNPTLLLKIGNVVYFQADDGVNGLELWKSDGTGGGTVIVKDITTNGSSKIRDMVDVNGTLFFLNGSPTEIWKSDGTEAGTQLIRNDLGYISTLCSMNGAIYFSASTGTIGNELWKSDGTASGTILVKDINTSTNTGSSPSLLTNISGVLYFTAYTPETGRELWKSDGTVEGTVMIKDIHPGATSSEISNLGFFGLDNTVYFSANDGVHGYELWKSDGTDAGTMMVTDLNVGSSSSGISAFVNVNGTLFFTAVRGYRALYKTDGTAQGTVQVQTNAYERPNNRPILLNETLYYEAYTSDVGFALWKSDGTVAGTSRIMDLNSYRNDNFYNNINYMTSFNGAVFFSGYDELRGWELWKTDGTVDGTNVVKEINMQGSSDVAHVARMGNHVYFRALDGLHGRELWKSDGTAVGTSLVKDISPFDKDGNPSYMLAAGSMLYFYADDGVHGRELWKSDGTTNGTMMVKDAVPGSGNLFSLGKVPGFTAVGDIVYFSSYTDNQESQLWRSDGTESGTYALTNKGVYPIFSINETLYFVMDDGVNGSELWKTDGTVDGTAMVKDINPTGGSSVSNFVNVNGTLYFTATDGVNGIELWKSDGTTDGTMMVKDVNPAGDGFLYYVIVAAVHNNILYFSADNGTTGRELWKTDGTEQGTVMVKDINQGTGGSGPAQLTAANGYLYFTVSIGGSTGRQLWRSDGTSEGTVKVKDDFGASPGFTSDFSLKLFTIDGVLYVLNGEPSNSMTELWTVNGLNACRVAESKDLYSYDPYVVVNKKVFIRAFSYEHGGVELFMYDGSNDVPCKKTQTISFVELPTDIRANDGAFTIMVSATSGLPINLTSSNTDVATVSGTTITPKAPGETEITATQEGDDVWAAAEPVTQVLVVDVILGLEDKESDDTLLFPNPFQNSFLFKINTSESVGATVRVYSITGNLIQQSNPKAATEYVMGESWTKGVYLIQIESGGKLIARKVVKH